MMASISTQTDDVAFHVSVVEAEKRDNWTQHENIHLARIEQLLLEQATKEQNFLDSTRQLDANHLVTGETPIMSLMNTEARIKMNYS